jgi:hypothetical protein
VPSNGFTLQALVEALGRACNCGSHAQAQVAAAPNIHHHQFIIKDEQTQQQKLSSKRSNDAAHYQR